MKKYKLMVMSYDGDYKIEAPGFDTIEEAWGYDIGSKWYFYPFHFIVSGETVYDAPDVLSFLNGSRIKTVAKIFEKSSKEEETQGYDPLQYSFYIADIRV